MRTLDSGEQAVGAREASAPLRGPSASDSGSTDSGSGPPAFRGPRPAGWLRFDSGVLNTEQTLQNLERVVSLLQTAQEGLIGLDNLLSDAITLTNAHWVDGDREHPPQAAVAERVGLRLNQMDEIVRQCRFHGRGLLDGQSGVVGLGVGVTFLRGGPNTVSSPPVGYGVQLTQLPARAQIVGGVPLDEAWLKDEEEVFLAEGERYVRYKLEPGETAASLVDALREEIRTAGIDLEVGRNGRGHLVLRHNQYGSQYKFKASSLRTPLLAHRPGRVEWSRSGTDIAGTLGGEPAFGIGRMLVGYLDNAYTSELAVVWQGGLPPAASSGSEAGRGHGARCHAVQNGIRFQDGRTDEPPTCIALPSFSTALLGQWMDSPSGFESLRGVDFETWQELRDSLHLMFAVSFELEDWKERVEGWIKRYQGQALTCLRRTADGAKPSAKNPMVTAQQAENMARQLRCQLQQGALNAS